MPNRRDFLNQTAILSSLMVPALTSCSVYYKNSLPMPSYSLDKIGIQLFSLPKLLDQDFLGAVKMLQKMGYTELELYGPYS